MNPTQKPPKTDPEGSSEGQQEENWEARFKGLQREFNPTKESLIATQKALDEAMQQLTGVKDTLTSKETEASQFRTALEIKDKEFQDKLKELSDAQSKLTSYEKRGAIRSKMLAAGATDLIPFFEDGFLAIESDDDEVVTGKVEAFRERLKAFGGGNLSGASVPNTTPMNTGNFKNPGELMDWLSDPRNFSKQEYKANQALYDKLSDK